MARPDRRPLRGLRCPVCRRCTKTSERVYGNARILTHDALQVLIDEAWRGRRWVVETDIASCFEAIPHDRLMQTVEERICVRQILKLLRAFLAAGVMEAGVVHRAETGTPR